MNWRNIRDELPEEGKLILARFDSHDSDRVSYWACKRDGEDLSMAGCGCFAVSRYCETYWVYISEIESEIDKSSTNENSGLKCLAKREAQP